MATGNKAAARNAAVATPNPAPAGGGDKSVKVVARAAKFRRCGYEFGAEPTFISLGDITQEDLERIVNEPNLVTEVVDTPKAEASTEAPKA